MECGRIKKSLSEYIDGALDNKTMSTLEGHLKTCRECYKEYISLKSLVSEIGSMRTLKAPEDFLEKVHECIESRSMFKNIGKILFFPARIKIPMELIALAATALLIFTVFNMVTSEKYFIPEPPETGEAEGIIKPGTVAEEITDGVVSAVQPGKEGAPIQLALLLGADQTTSPLSSENVLLVTSGNGTGGSDRSSFGFAAEQPQKIDFKSAIISAIYEIISLEGGRLLLKEYRNGTDHPEYITLEVPGTNYRQFLEKIENIGTLQTPAPDLPKDYQERISLRIHIIP
ncbi:zf-HC2 domain-containing protein [Deltaproteobacteria bacterium]|nr:zf-HC2 domain-containing protein [Deltaproteobacteria bacterium]